MADPKPLDPPGVVNLDDPLYTLAAQFLPALFGQKSTSITKDALVLEAIELAQAFLAGAQQHYSAAVAAGK
jgi:hypothetical protein